MPPILNTQNDQPEQQEEQDDLRSALSEAFDNAPAEGEEQTPDQHQVDDEGQPRDERGRWTKAQQEHYEQQERERAQAEQGQQQQRVEEDPNGGGIVLAPPHGWSPAAKAAYATLPPAVQEAVARREIEVNNGFKKLQQYKDLEDYAKIAQESGTTIREALDRYKAAEDALDADFFGGTMQLCQMYGWHPVQLAQEIMQRFTQQQGQPGYIPTDPNATLLAQRLRGMEDTVRTLISEREQQETEAINGQLQQFAQNALYFENVRQDMADLIRTGRADTLEDAYDKACWMNPEIRALLISEQASPQNAQARVQKARKASGSLKTGAPAGSSQGSSANSIREALAEAWDASS